MKSYHIHISGLVQGVGFRPYVFQLAEKTGITGWVSNTNDGVHIEFNAEDTPATDFYNAIISSPPANAVITSHSMRSIPFHVYHSFKIITDSSNTKPDLLLTPDFAICENCRQEITDQKNRRFNYPFTTCLQCGPRYSISRELPYERDHTTMNELMMCEDCKREYDDVYNRRHYSQTNSCPSCAVPMHLYDAGGLVLSNDNSIILHTLNEALKIGNIVAVKGTGGYLLMCDATNKASILLLRRRKHRPAKPFALLYDTIEQAQKDVHISDKEKRELSDKAGPIVLCRLKPAPENKICTEAISPGLDKIGLMLPCSPLLQLIAAHFKNPLIATSANISGSPIIYQDNEAIHALAGIADYFITYERDILLPQDDSVMQITEKGNRIIIRRSRGLAPNYFPNPFSSTGQCILALGGELKSAFAIQAQHHLYVSQYLGNQENYLSQKAYTHTVKHLIRLLQLQPSLLLADKHPGYFVSQAAADFMAKKDIPMIAIQHHKAHFGAVLAENHLLNTTEPVLGIIWDGAGYGDDKQIWGGEFFVYRDMEIKRVAHLAYFPQLLGDKMNREPRLSALSLFNSHPAAMQILRSQFSDTEWQFYLKLIKQPAQLFTSSMGRLLDAVASILNVCPVNSYEGEAAMKLEAVARNYHDEIDDDYPIPLHHNRFDLSYLLEALTADILQKKETAYIAKKTIYSLAMTIARISDHINIDQIAFSGGVFQNALLTDRITELLSGKKKLFWHKQLSPNDECIGFGQLACYQLMHTKKYKEGLAATSKSNQLNYQPLN